MKKIQMMISFLALILVLSALLALPLSSESRLELSTMPMITTDHTDIDHSNQAPSNDTGTFGNLSESARVLVLLAGTGIIGIACINRNTK